MVNVNSLMMTLGQYPRDTICQCSYFHTYHDHVYVADEFHSNFKQNFGKHPCKKMNKARIRDTDLLRARLLLYQGSFFTPLDNWNMNGKNNTLFCELKLKLNDLNVLYLKLMLRTHLKDVESSAFTEWFLSSSFWRQKCIIIML